MITIGLDPHPDSHTVAALDENGTTLASLTVSNDAEGLARLHQFTLPFPEHRWAVEGAANRFILPFVCELLELDAVVSLSSLGTGVASCGSRRSALIAYSPSAVAPTMMVPLRSVRCS